MPDRSGGRSKTVNARGRLTEISIPIGPNLRGGSAQLSEKTDSIDYGPLQFYDPFSSMYLDHAIYTHYVNDGTLLPGLKIPVISTFAFFGRLAIPSGINTPESAIWDLKWTGASGVTDFAPVLIDRPRNVWNQLHYANNDGPEIDLSPRGDITVRFIFNAEEIFDSGGDPEFYINYMDWIATQIAPGVIEATIEIDGKIYQSSDGTPASYTFARIPIGGYYT